MKSKLEFKTKVVLKYVRKDFWFPCYTAWDYDKDIDIVISKLHGTWRVGIYRENIDWQPYPLRKGFYGAYKTLKQAKKIVNTILEDWNDNYFKGGK